MASVPEAARLASSAPFCDTRAASLAMLRAVAQDATPPAAETNEAEEIQFYDASDESGPDEAHPDKTSKTRAPL